MRPNSRGGAFRWLTTLMAILALSVPQQSDAQSVNASLRGRVYGPGNVPLPDATVTLSSATTGFRRGTVTNEAGLYFIGAVPPGMYVARVQRIGMTPVEQTVRMPVAEIVTLDLTVAEAAITLGPVVTVASASGVDARTPEVSTNVSTAQIENLPLNNRNFLTLATLAPGVQERSSGVSSAGASVNNSNLFVDGASYKSDILPGGVAGQDPSLARNIPGIGRVQGNPFPQSAVQEFRVISQNYKAEYQKATGAVITAATKSGSNVFSGDVFLYSQNQSMFASSYWDIRNKLRQPDYRRNQFGLTLGGPIVRDRTHFFASYEGNIQNLEETIRFNPPASLPAPPASVLAGQGLYPVPLNAHLFFGKVDHQLGDRQNLMASLNLRRDADERFFGGSPEGRERVDTRVNNLLVKHSWNGTPFTNEAQVNFQRFQWTADPVNLSQPRLEYREYGIARGGGRSFQDFIQNRLELRNDITWPRGSHLFKGGATLAFLTYDVERRNDENPVFRFNPPGSASDPFPTIPAEAVMQVGNPNLKTSNRQFGLYVQDDWTVSQRLALNVGVRWDVESDWLNNNYVTPDSAANALRTFAASNPFYKAEDYITNGKSRPSFLGAVQPRVGFSYDLSGTNRTIVFGGGGLYYDRVPYSVILDEKARLQRPAYVFRFSESGGGGTIAWDPSYQSREGLLRLLASGQAGRPELYAINNNQKPPRSLQTSLGLRHSMGQYSLGVTGTYSRGDNYFKWIVGDRNPTNFDRLRPQVEALGYDGIILSTDAGKTRHRSLQFSASRAMSGDMRWGGNLNYTLSKTEVNHYQDVEDPFALDYIRGHNVYGFDFIPSRYDERHRIVANFMTRLWYGVRFNTVTSLGSGFPYTLTTGCQGPWDFPPGDPNNFCNRMGYTRPSAFIPSYLATPPGVRARSERPEGKWFGPFGKWAYRNVDVRLQKDFGLRGGHAFGISADVYNVFNFVNFNYDNMEYNLRWDTNQGAGPFRERIPFGTFNARRAQVGVRYAF